MKTQLTAEQYGPVVRFMRRRFKSVDEILIEQYFTVVLLLMLHKVLRTFESGRYPKV